MTARMGKFSSNKRDPFFNAKKQKWSDGPNTKRNFKKQDQPTTSGSFFIKSNENLQKSESRKNKQNYKKPEKKRSTNKPTPEDIKKPFDKKKWRLQKYSKKYKLEQWEDRRKKTLLHDYYKQVENEPKIDVQKIYERYADDEAENDNENNLNSLEVSTVSSLTPSNFVPPDDPEASTSQSLPQKTSIKTKVRKKAHEIFQRKQDEKKQRIEEIAKKKAEKAEALKVYKQKKLEKFKKLNKRTKKGQPIMKYRMEMLLEQIQKSVQ